MWRPKPRGDGGVLGNKSEVSYGGGLVRDLLATGDYHMLLNLNLTKGGPWTRICPGTGNLSCLDLSIGSTKLLPFVWRVLVDSERMYTPRRPLTKGGRITVKYTDHYGVVVDLEMPMAEEEPTVPPGWNTNKPGGWEAFKEAGEKHAEDIQEIVDNEEYTIEEMMEKIEKINTKMKWIPFSKTKPRTKTATNKETVAETTDEQKGK